MSRPQIIKVAPRQFGVWRQRRALVRWSHKSIRKGSKSFDLASRLFDRHTRERVWLLYAWCRRCDDITDGQDHGQSIFKFDEASARQRAMAVRLLTDRALAGEPTAEKAFDALRQVSAECRITQEDVDAVIEGFALDAQSWRPRTEDDLLRYCYHVAGAVGVMMAKVMNVSKEDLNTLDRACDLGIAFQLNNIARDISEDDVAGRCYIPVEWLAEADIPPGEHMRPEFREQLVGLVARMLDLAEMYEAAARYGAGGLAFRQRWAVLSAAGIYGAIGHKVRKAGAHAWDHRVRTGLFTKLKHILAGFGQALVAAPTPDEWPRLSRQALSAASKERPAAMKPLAPLPDED